MTLIALFQTSIGPVFFGDLLLSAATPNDQIRLPTLGEVTQEMVPSEWHWSPCGLRPKLAIINDNLAMAWAGPEFVAGLMVRELVSRPAQQLRSVEAVAAVIEEVTAGSSLAAQSTFLACIRQENGFRSLAYGDHQYIELNSAGIERAWIGGSGSRVLRENLEAGAVRYGQEDPDPRTEVSFKIATLGSWFTAMDSYYYRHTLLRGFGGGYETIIFNENRFQYWDDITYLTWGAEIEIEAEMLHIRPPSRAFRLGHFHDAPIIRTMRMRVRPDDSLETSDRELYLIIPFDVLTARMPRWPPVEAEAPSFRTSAYMNTFLVRELGTEPTEMFVSLAASGDLAAGGLEFCDGDGRFGFQYSGEFIDKVRRLLVLAWGGRQQRRG